MAAILSRPLSELQGTLGNAWSGRARGGLATDQLLNPVHLVGMMHAFLQVLPALITAIGTSIATIISATRTTRKKPKNPEDDDQ